jgi:membrane protease YdiL (CAAX protease family)
MMCGMEELLANADAGSRLLYNIINWTLLLGGMAVASLLWLHERSAPPDRHALTETLVQRSWETFQVGILLSSLLLLYTLAMFTGRFFYEDQIPLAKLGVTIVIYAILVGIITVINRFRHGNWASSCGMGLHQLKKLALAPVLYLAFIPFLMLASKGWHLLLQHLFHVEVELQDVAQVVTQELSWLQIGYMFTAIFVAPIYEELMFRGIIFPYLVKRSGLISATVLVSLLFALLHFHTPSALPLFLLSTALCMAYWRTGSLWVSIGMHTLFNAVSILALNMVG